MRGDLKAIFLSGVESVRPGNLLRKSISVRDEKLMVKGEEYSLKSCYVVGFGKAALGMAVEMENILGACLKEGIVMIPIGTFHCFNGRTDMLPVPDTKIRFIEGAPNDLPDEKAYEGALEIKRLASSLKEDDLLIVLVSGGGSALLPLPKSPITLEEKKALIKELSIRGADIVELNCVRKKLSEMKGGGLAKITMPARMVCLILSDIIGDPIDFIASGPTVPNLDKDGDALNVIEKYDLLEKIPESITNILKTHENGETGLINDSFKHVNNFVIGNNKIATEEAKKCALEMGYETIILSTRIKGGVYEVSKIYADLACLIVNGPREKLQIFTQNLFERFKDIVMADILNLNPCKKICIISAGEPTVVVKGNGLGGRNQELALRFSVEIAKMNVKAAEISFLSAGTDGIDGPTDASGAIGSSNLVNFALAEGLDPNTFLENNDSYNFYSKYNEGKYLIKTGHTGTNVMDLHIIIIEPEIAQ